jgi:pimeloyl-ACP methyl ester carboxylesterase
MESPTLGPPVEHPVRIRTGDVDINGDLAIPQIAAGIVLFAHGSGSSRHSPRNRFVAEVLREAGLATLLLDLLTATEESRDMSTAEFRFDIGLLADRVVGATDWLADGEATAELPVGYFGASTGAAAALVAAARRPERVRAVVSRGGRPDLAADELPRVKARTLLIVGGDDEPVIGLNRQALDRLGPTEKGLHIVPGATHLFEEPGTLAEVARLAADWFARHLVG